MLSGVLMLLVRIEFAGARHLGGTDVDKTSGQTGILVEELLRKKR